MLGRRLYMSNHRSSSARRSVHCICGLAGTRDQAEHDGAVSLTKEEERFFHLGRKSVSKLKLRDLQDRRG